MINDGVEIFDSMDRDAMAATIDAIRAIKMNIEAMRNACIMVAGVGKGGCVRDELDTAQGLIAAAISDGLAPALHRLECALNEPSVRIG